MKTLLTLLAVTGFAGTALAQTSTPPPVPSPGLGNQKLAVWYGEWTYTGETFATPAGPAGKFTGRMIGRPIQNGFAGEFIYDEKGASGEARYLEIDFWDPVIKDHAYIFVGTDGYAERGTFSMKGDLTTFENTIMLEGRLMKIKGTETVAPDRQSFTRKVELLTDSKTWAPFTDTKFTKVAAPTVEQELIKLENDWAQAYLVRDLKTLGRIEAEEWICTAADGTVLSKKDDIGDVASGAFVATVFDMADLKVQVYGDTAVVTGRQTEKATYKGKDASAVHRITDVWIRRDGRWQAIASHLSKLAQ